MQALIRQAAPGSSVQAVKVKDAVMLLGWVDQAGQATKIVELFRLAKPKDGLLMFAGFLRLEAALINLPPLGMFVPSRGRAVRRAERRAVLEVDGDGAEDDARARAPAGLEDVLEIALKVPIDDRHPWVVGGDAVFEEHQHAAPLALAGGGFAELPDCPVEQLADARRLDREAGAHDREPGRLRPEDGARAERPDDFVIAHVKDPDIAVRARAIAGDGQYGVRTDAGHRGIDDLESRAGMTAAPL